MSFRNLLLIVALVALSLFATSASAQCRGNRGNNRVNVNVNRNVGNLGLRQQLIGNQLVTFDRFGNVVRQQFLNRNSSLLNVNSGLADRLLLGL